MPTIRFIGDVHGLYKQYKRLIDSVDKSIQLGDMGVGFRRSGGARTGDFHVNPPHYAMVRGDHRFIRGNHDNPAECAKHSQWIFDGKLDGDMMFIGGALSVDREYRTEGYDWWPGEELTIGALNSMVDVYAKAKPRIMVTHDCPERIAVEMCRLSGRNKLDFPSRTRQAFDSMFEMHQPEKWLFAHWHHSADFVADGTQFTCLNELEYRDIDISGL